MVRAHRPSGLFARVVERRLGERCKGLFGLGGQGNPFLHGPPFAAGVPKDCARLAQRFLVGVARQLEDDRVIVLSHKRLALKLQAGFAEHLACNHAIDRQKPLFQAFIFVDGVVHGNNFPDMNCFL